MSTIRVRSRGFTALLCGTALFLPLASTSAFAQAGASEDDDSTAIIVTAQRRDERLEDVPMSVALVNQETLTNAGINTVRDLANVTSGFQLGTAGSTPQPSIRGITAILAGSYENNVALFVDGLYQVTPQVLNMDLPNVQSIQILKGAQGTLYGRNATGGAILIDTIDPGEDWTGNVEATYGRFNDRRARAYVGGPLSDTIGFSIAGTYRQNDGYFKQASRTTPGTFDGRFLGLKQYSIRTKLKAELSPTFTATLAYSYIKAADPRGVVFTPIENVSNSYSAAAQRDTRPRELGEAAGDIFDVDFRLHEGSLKLEWETGIGKLRTISGYSVGKGAVYFDFNGTYAPDLYAGSDNRDRTFQQTLDFNINAIDNLELIVGANYYNIKFDFFEPNTTYFGPSFYTPFTLPTPNTSPIPLGDPRYRKANETLFFRTKNAWAAYMDATYRLSDKLTIGVGGRYSKETQDVAGSRNVYCLDPLAATAPQANCGTIGSVLPITGVPATSGVPYTIASSAKTSRYSKFTPRASIRYEISPGTNIYATYSKGFRGGEWNTILPGDNPANWFDVKQESVDSYEIGFKTVGRNFRLELAGFLSDFKDLQVSNTQQVNGLPLVVLANAPRAKSYGAEINFDFKPTDNFTIKGGAAWLHARYGRGFVLTGTGVNPAVAGFNTNADPLKTFGNQTLAQDLSGLQMPRAPDFSGFVGLDYNIPNGEGGLRFSANLKYTSSYAVTNPTIWGGEPTATFNPKLLANPLAIPDNTAIFNATPAGAAFVSRASEQRLRQEAFAMLNASVTWTDPTDHYFVRVWGNNLTNATYRIHYNALSSGTYAPIGEPLTFGGTVGYKF